MTREKLEEIRDLKLTLRRLNQKLHDLDMRSPVSSPSAGEIHGSGTSDKVANTAAKRITLECKISDIQREIKRREAFINAIQDYDTREIIWCRCVQGYTFAQISERVFMPEETVKTRYFRFFKKFSENP